VQFLPKASSHVGVPSSAFAALNVLDAFASEAVLLDIGLPHMSGHELARRIRSKAGGDKVLLVAITGWGQQRDREMSRAAGIDQHLTKPVALDALESLLASGKRT
jgi:DNA-binding response OmpR family regulator